MIIYRKDRACPVFTVNNHNDDKITLAQKRFRNPGQTAFHTIIGGYKAAVGKHAKRLHIDFSRQNCFYNS